MENYGAMRDSATWLKPLTRESRVTAETGETEQQIGGGVLIHRTRAEFRAPTQQLTTTANSVSELSNTFFQPPQPPVTHMEHIHVVCRQNTPTH